MATRMYVCESAEHPSTLLSGLNEQRLKGRLCDVSVKVQGNIFQAHINVLAAAMGYFRDLFSKPLKEKTDDMIEIPIIVNTTGFAKILDFVYTSQLCLSQSTVMQVLCSACYLQIPYVVEKCQEFISTHGHVTSPSSLSEVTAPLLQDLHRQNFPKQSPQVHNTSASASLSFLSQLNRLSSKSQPRMPTLQQSSKSISSPQRGQLSEEQQECELINTPPSPGRHSLTNGEGRTSPDSSEPHPGNKDPSKISNMLPLKRERDVETSSSDDKQAIAVYSPQDRFSRSFNGLDTKKKFIYTSPNGHTQDLIVADSQSEIDHKSLAEYFSTEKDQAAPPSHVGSNNALIGYPFQIDNNLTRNGEVLAKHQHIMSMAKTLQRERMLENNQSQSFSLHPKKDKPKKEYGCDYCGKMFGRQQHLKRHILTHTGERPYPCQYCEKRFRRSEHLKHHLVSHEQAMGIDGQMSRKRPRKTQQVADAYAMSKMMLDRYNGQMEIDGSGNMVENGTIASAPVILPSMFTDAERRQMSPQTKLTELDCGMGSRDSSDGKANDANSRQGSPSYDVHSPMTALNLSRVSPREPEELRLERQNIPSPTENSPGNCNNVDRTSEHAKPVESDQNSPRSSSLSPPLNGCNGIFNENPTSSDIIGMEGSEVLTTDLKRLIAAMDE